MGYRTVLLSPAILREFLTHGVKGCVITEGLPEDAQFVGIGYTPAEDPYSIRTVWYSVEWAGPSEGCAPPSFHIAVETWRLPDDESLLGEVGRALRECFPDRAEMMTAELARRLLG